jgi:N-acetyl-anhydromuramoyl-L-alanine amidase
MPINGCARATGVQIGADHWIDGVVRCASPNCDDRTDPDDVALVVVHNISLPPGQFGGGLVQQFFTNCLDCTVDVALSDLEGVRVSSHLFVDRRGNVTQFVPFHRRAWHAGVSSYRGREGCNDYSIGVELEGTDDVDYDEAQYVSLAALVVALMNRYPRLSLDGIVGHQEIAPQRKSDPGTSFDWSRLFRDVLRTMGVSGVAHRS